MSEQSDKTVTEINEIQRLIGRNVLLFQNVEHILKIINHYGKGKGTFENLKERKKKIDELSLGRLTDTNRLKKIDKAFNKETDTEITFSYDFLPDNARLIEAIKFLNSKNEDRNFLVHNITTKWGLDNPAHRQEAKLWLLTLFDEVFEQRQVLVQIMESINERGMEWLEVVNSEAFDAILKRSKK